MDTTPTLAPVANLASGPLSRARTNLAVVERLVELGNATPTDDDLALLARWSGWGPMAKAFEPKAEPAWAEIGQRLAVLLPPAALAEARAAVTTAYYTSNEVMTVMWRMAMSLGVTDGARVLEPGCGSGRFIAAAPIDVAAFGVEKDPTTARIAQLLLPAATIVNKPMQEVVLVDETFDLAIGNVPFSEATPYDRAAPEHGMPLHNYFLWRALRAVRPGGYLIAVTSRYTLDSAKAVNQRATLDRLGEFVGAVRLPRGAFRDAGTDVVADIVALRRRPVELDPPALDGIDLDGWLGVEQLPRDDDHQFGVMPMCNRYFLRNPAQVVGKLGVGHGQYRDDELLVTAPDGDYSTLLAHAAVAVITAGEKLPPVHADPVVDLDEAVLAADDGRKLGSFHFDGDDGTVIQIVPGTHGGAVAKPVKASKELASLIVLRNAVLDLLDLEARRDVPDDSPALRLHRAILNSTYDAYVKRFGPVNRCSIFERGADPETGIMRYMRRRPSMGGFREDPDYVAVCAVENYDDDTQTASKGPIFERRVNRPPTPVTSVDTPGEAMAVSMDRHGAIRPALVAALLGISVDDVGDALDGHAFFDPEVQGWVPAAEYLSGNVRAKLAKAREAVKDDPRLYHSNVAKLTEVQPVDLLPEDIHVRLGAPWLPLQVIVDFMAHLLKVDESYITVTRERITATWEVSSSYDKKSTWDSPRMTSSQLVQAGLNNSRPEVYDTIDKVRVLNKEQTLLAVEKLDAIQAEFAQWVWADPARAEHLAHLYNERYNATVLRTYDGADLTFPGIADWFNPYPHQRAMVARALAMPATACGHPVGAGKTSIMAMTAMKLRETGMAHKPAAVVPNHLLEQVAREIKALYPTKRILMASSDDVKKERRKLFAAKVATGDWDLVVMTHSAFGALAVSPRLERRYLAEKIARYDEALNSFQKEGTGRAGNRTVKQVEKAKEKLLERSKKLLDAKVDDGVTWDVLGIDFLMVDEAHYFKNLGFPTRSGYGPPASKRAEGLALKLWTLRHGHIGNGSRIGMLLSGTLISNTLAEAYVFQSYLQPERLEELEIEHFDAWAGMFVQDETKIEVAPDGGSFRMNTRPSRFNNVPELLVTFAEVADLQTREKLGLLGPDAVYDTVVVPPSDALTEYVDSLVERADMIRGGGVDPHDDNMLKVCTDGRKAALDLALVGVHTRDRGKLDPVVDRVYASWLDHQTTEYLGMDGQPSPVPGNLQVVFCDLGTPNSESSQVYGKIRRALVERGMPVQSIRFIHEATTDSAKAVLFSECRSGKVSVLLGSTDKLGVGTNVQHRMTDIHHVDAPWRPADVEQREGRGIRPGNQNPTIRVHRYVRERSFDAYMWQGLERKARFIAQVLNGDPTVRQVNDIDSTTTLSFAEVKALSTGNPLVMEHAEATAMVSKLQRVQDGHAMVQRRLDADTRRALEFAASYDEQAGRYDLVHAAVDMERGWTFDRFGGLDDHLYDREEVGKAVGHKIMEGFASTGRRSEHLGYFRGVELRADLVRGSDWGSTSNRATVYARIGADQEARMFDVDVAAWLKEGQWWRLGRELQEGFGSDELVSKAAEARARAQRQRVEAQRLTDQRGPFPQADELAAAVARLGEIEAAMDAEVNKKDDDTDEAAA